MTPEESQANRLSREQKIGFGLLLIFAILTVGLGALQIRNSMYEPFALNKEIPGVISDKIDTVAALHYRDTDFDGLNDFDELYVYGTSPYLADTDSDGVNDKEEIAAGKNPVCAEGRACEGETLPTAAPAPQAATSTSENFDMAAIFNAINDPKQLREALKAHGLDEATLKNISDEELLKAAVEIMSDTSTLR